MRDLILWCLLLGGVSSATAADPLDTWYWRNPSPQGNPLHGVCFGEEEFVAVGANGTVMTSPDGEAWLNQESGTRIPLHGVTHAAGRFVAVGELGLIFYSDDARSWQRADSPWFYHLYAVTWGNGLYVAVGEDSAVLTSPDGVTWTLRVTGSEPLNDVAYGGGTFLAVGGRYTGGTFNSPIAPTQIMIASENGINWEARQPGFPGTLTAAHYWKNEFHVGIWPSSRSYSFVLSSFDTVTWLPSSGAAYSATPIQCFVSDATRMLAFLGNNSVIVYAPVETTDGRTWRQSSDASTEGVILAAAAGQELMVAVGTGPYWYAGPAGLVRGASSNWRPVIWTKTAPRSIVRNGSVIGGLVDLATDDGDYWTYASFSTNGYHWSSNFIAQAAFTGLFSGNGLFVAREYFGSTLASSADGTNWQLHTNIPTPPLVSFLGGNGAWLYVVQENEYWRSSDLDNWDEHPLPEGSSWDQVLFAFGGDRFLCIHGGAGKAYHSPDGIVWQAEALSGVEAVSTLHYAQDRWLAVGAHGAAFVSTNGWDWAPLGHFGGNLWASELDYQDGRYVVAAGTGNLATLLTSSDEGATWIARHPGGVNEWFRTMMAFNSVLVWTWNYNKMMQSAPLQPTTPLSLDPLASRAIRPGDSVTLNASLYGSPPLTHEWYRDGLLVTGAVEPLLAVRDLAEGAAHEYTLVTSNAHGSVTNGPARIVVGQPATLGVAADTSVNGSLTGTAGLTYRVDYRDGSPVEGAWQTLTNLTLSGSNGVFTDVPPTNRFYRAELVP
jgi:hypothetical protein